MAGPAKIIVWREEFVAARGGRFERSSGCKSRRCRRSDCCRQQPGQVRSRVAFRATRTVRAGPDAVKEVRDLTKQRRGRLRIRDGEFGSGFVIGLRHHQTRRYDGQSPSP